MLNCSYYHNFIVRQGHLFVLHSLKNRAIQSALCMCAASQSKKTAGMQYLVC